MVNHRINKEDFCNEMVECIDTKIMSEKLGDMFLKLIDNTVNNTSGVNVMCSDSTLDELRGFLLDELIDKFRKGMRPTNDMAFLSYYSKALINALINIRNRRLLGTSRNDLYGKSIMEHYTNDNGKHATRRTNTISIDKYIEEIENYTMNLDNGIIFVVLPTICLYKYIMQ